MAGVAWDDHRATLTRYLSAAESQIWLLDLASGQRRQLLPAAGAPAASHFGGAWKHDDSGFFFLGDRSMHASGSAVTALMEGSRPILIEIQALAAKAGFGTPQRVATGYDGRRLALLLAVLDKRAGLSFGQLDVFLNVVGGVRLQEPAGDLAVAVALASSVYDRSLSHDAVFVGEVGLGGEIRPVSQAERRLAEAANLGMTTAYLAERAVPARVPKGLKAVGVRTISDLFERVFA